MRSTLRWLLVPAAAVFAILAAAPGMEAQEPVRRNLFTINPLGIPFEYFSGEYERSISGLTSLGLQGSYLNIDDGSYSTVEAKLRFYPNEEWPRGFAIGLAGGITRVKGEQYNAVTQQNAFEAETRPTIAVIVDYNWVMGKSQRVIVGAGVGAKRLIGTSGDFLDIDTGYPTARFQIGVKF